MTPRLAFLPTSLLQYAESIPPWTGLGNGVAALKRKDYKAASREFKLLAEQGDADAQFFLGTLYQQGYGVDSNISNATV